MADGSVKIDIIADDNGIEKTLDNVSNDAEDAAGGLDKLSDSAEDMGKEFGTADVAVGTFVGNALSDLVSKVGEAIGNIIALADETREYREDMAKLDTAFTSAGHSTETAQKAYDSFYKILGESDRSVEAVNHLAELTKSEEEVAKWGTIAAGVMARFGDSLPIEGLTEAANETAKVGAVTGPLADALNWAGISEDDFNKKLAACNSEQERATLITNTLNKEYEAAATEYNELTANAQAARDATNNMEQAQAALGAAIEPVTTAMTNLKANALQWMLDNLPAIGVIIGGLAAAVAIYNAKLIETTIATKAAAAAQTLLTIAQNMSPLGWIVLGITAVVGAFMLLWNNCEGFRNFWIGLWEGIKTVAKAVADWIKVAWTATLEWFKGAVEKIKEFFSSAWEGIKEVFSNSIIGQYFSAIWETIKGIFAVIKAVLSGNWSDAWEAIKGIVGTWANFFSGVWDKIKGVFSVIGSWFSQKFTEAKNNIFSAFSNIKEKFSEIWTRIKEAFNIGDMLKIGKDLLEGLWNGINDKVAWLKSKVSGVVDKIKGWFTGKDGFDTHSPSKWSEEVAVNVNKGFPKGFDKSIDIPVKAAQATTERIKAAVSLEQARMSQCVGVRDTGFTDIAHAVGMQTAGINSLASEYRRGSKAQVTIPLVLDKRELGRAVVELGDTETERIGTNLVLA